MGGDGYEVVTKFLSSHESLKGSDKVLMIVSLNFSKVSVQGFFYHRLDCVNDGVRNFVTGSTYLCS